MRQHSGFWILSLLLSLLALPSLAESTGKHPDAPRELAALEFLIGEWDLTTSFAQADGSRREERAELVARWVLGGFGIAIEETHPYAEGGGGVFVSTVIYTVHPETRGIVGASHNTLGNRKLYELTVEEEGLSIVQKGELFGGRKGFNRQWLHDISDQRFALRLDSCSESGECHEGSYSYVATRRLPNEASEASASAAGPGVPEVARRYLELYAAQDLDACAQLLAPDAVFQDSAMTLEGRDAIVEGLGRVFETLTLEGFDILRWIESGPHLVAVDLVVRFQQDAGFAGRPGTTVRFEIPMVMVLEIAAGKIVRHLDLVDLPRYLEQLHEQLRAASRADLDDPGN